MVSIEPMKSKTFYEYQNSLPKQIDVQNEPPAKVMEKENKPKRSLKGFFIGLTLGVILIIGLLYGGFVYFNNKQVQEYRNIETECLLYTFNQYGIPNVTQYNATEVLNFMNQVEGQTKIDMSNLYNNCYLSGLTNRGLIR